MDNFDIDGENFRQYLNDAPEICNVHFWDLPKGTPVGLKSKPENLNLRGHTQTVTVRRLLKLYGQNSEIEKNIKFLLNWRNKNHRINVRFPLSLKNVHYVKLYALMISEGSFNSEFRLQVPEKEFHTIFVESLEALFRDVMISHRIDNNVPITYAPAKISSLLPMPRHIPRFILNNKEFSRIYLRIAFEAEGSLHLIKHKTGTHRRIKLSRNLGIDDLVVETLHYQKLTRIYKGALEKDYPQLFARISQNPCPTILGELYMLKKHFDVDAKIVPEYIRINKTSFRRGKISVKWTLTIHGQNINRFIDEVGFVTKGKIEKSRELLKIHSHRRRHFALTIIDAVKNDDVFTRFDFMSKMDALGYTNAQCFLYRYLKQGKIKRLERGKYLLLRSFSQA